jgi:hypothetical protein
MKKVLLIAAALGALSLPALAQQSPTGQSSGGPARVGTPGQIGGGVPGASAGQAGMAETSTAPRKSRKAKKARRAKSSM